MHELLDQELDERNEHDYIRFLLLDYCVHLRMAEVSDNPFLLRTPDHLVALNIRLWFDFFRVQGSLPVFA